MARRKKKCIIISDPEPEFSSLLEELPLEEGEALPDGVIMRASGKVGQADRVTQTGRIYRRSVLESQIEAIAPNIQRNAVHGLSGHPNPGTYPDPDKEFGTIKKLWINEDGSVHANWEILDTPSGRIFATKVRAGVHTGFSSRGNGSSKVVKYSESLPEYNEDDAKKWNGKPVQIINDDYMLTTYDHVVMGSVTSTDTVSFSEDQEANMEIKDLTEEQWKEILESEKCKNLIWEAVKQQTEDVEKMVVQYLESEEGQVVVKEKLGLEETLEVETVETVKCAKCEFDMLTESKFCPDCGEKVEIVEAAVTSEQKDEVITTLTEQVKTQDKLISDLTSRLDEMQAEKKAAENSIKVNEILDTVLKDADKVVTNLLRKRFDEGKLAVTPEDAEKVFTDELEFIKSVIDQGQNKEVPAGDGKVIPIDETAANEDEKAVVDGVELELANLL